MRRERREEGAGEATAESLSVIEIGTKLDQYYKRGGGGARGRA